MTTQGRHRRPHLMTTAGTAILALAAAGLVLVTWAIAQPGDRTPPDDAAPSVGTTSSRAQSAAVASRAADCRAADRLATRDMAAVDVAIVQWRRHIDAMTDLVAGKISLAQANDFWDATRLAGRQSLAQWHRVDRLFLRDHGSCSKPVRTTNDTVRSCQERVAAATDVLAAARHTLDDWAVHVEQMEQLRAGKLSPAHALHLWNAMYQRGLVGLRHFDAENRAYGALPACQLA
ncbi:MAG: hypothetical protein ACRDV1_09795 [Actinomycetes bacterium]